MAAMLAHEVKNPLSGIRGAAQLLERDTDPNGTLLTRLICDETDRIVALVDRMEMFADQRPIDRRPVNIHRSEEHTSELQSLMRISYAVFCLKKKKKHNETPMTDTTNTSKIKL